VYQELPVLKGIHLSLQIGPLIPTAAPYEVMSALNSIEVSAGTKQASAFQLTFELSNASPLHARFLRMAASGAPILRVIVAVTLNSTPSVLIDGVMTNHQAAPSSRGKTTLTVTGEDLTRLMDYQELDGFPFPATPPFARVALILAKYAPLGVVPMVIPGFVSDLPNPLERIPRQQGTDLAYINQLAEEAGYVFYQSPGPTPGISTAYWGPVVKLGRMQPALTANMDADGNVDDLSFTFDSERKTMPIALIQEPFSKLTIPVPVGDISPLNPPLGIATPIPKRFEILKETAKMPLGRAIGKALGVASSSSDVVSASGSLDVLRYGRILEPRKLVGVRGAGEAFDGTYYVETVQHQLKRGQYKQQFTLSRNALFSLSERVAV
jgi:hypothetical protein